VPSRTCQDAKWFPYPPPPFLLHNFNVNPKSWHFDYYRKKIIPVEELLAIPFPA